MGFKEEVKIHLSTRSAEISHGFSKAVWRIKDPVRPPNPLYRMKIQLSNAIIPNSFDKISAARGNNKLTFAFENTDATGSYVTPSSIDKDYYVTVTIPDIENPTPAKVYAALYDAMKTQMRANLPGQQFLPIVKYDPENNYDTFTFEVVDWDAFVDLPDHVPALPEEIIDKFKLLTTKDVALWGRGKISESMVGLADVLGFDDIGSWDLDQNPETLRISAQSNPDFIGSQFIKVMTNLNINNIDPNTLSYSRIMGVIPVTESEEGASVIYMAGGIQSPQYQTIGDPELKTIELELRDDRDSPLNVHDHWYIELTVMFEEEENTDVYRGLQGMTGPAENVTNYDPSGYSRLSYEVQSKMDNIRRYETEQRSDNFAYSGSKRNRP